jgi:glycine betaine/choline ABC-type transport system substrate-binding protein
MLFAALVAGMLGGCAKAEASDTIIVGGKDFSETDILGYMITILIDEFTDLKPEFKGEMASNVLFAAMQNRNVDVCVDYSGTYYINYLGYTDRISPKEIYDIAARDMMERFNLRMLAPLGFNNTYCLAVRPDTAEKYNLKTYSDLAKVSENLILGCDLETLARPDGVPNMKLEYNMTFKDELGIDGILRFISLKNDETQVTMAYSTEGMLAEFGLVVLEDDKGYFPPYDAAIIIQEATAQKHPQLLDVLGKLDNAIDEPAMCELNYKVEVLKEDPKEVAEWFLRTKGILR